MKFQGAFISYFAFTLAAIFFSCMLIAGSSFYLDVWLVVIVFLLILASVIWPRKLHI